MDTHRHTTQVTQDAQDTQATQGTQDTQDTHRTMTCYAQLESVGMSLNDNQQTGGSCQGVLGVICDDEADELFQNAKVLAWKCSALLRPQMPKKAIPMIFRAI